MAYQASILDGVHLRKFVVDEFFSMQREGIIDAKAYELLGGVLVGNNDKGAPRYLDRTAESDWIARMLLRDEKRKVATILNSCRYRFSRSDLEALIARHIVNDGETLDLIDGWVVRYVASDFGPERLIRLPSAGLPGPA